MTAAAISAPFPLPVEVLLSLTAEGILAVVEDIVICDDGETIALLDELATVVALVVLEEWKVPSVVVTFVEL
jgi:hypothetical protein